MWSRSGLKMLGDGIIGSLSFVVAFVYRGTSHKADAPDFDVHFMASVIFLLALWRACLFAAISSAIGKDRYLVMMGNFFLFGPAQGR
jgi:hypothetical protein